ncbi:MAG: hypothetical protein HUU38_20210 [Anaerolineales bacterium]|nr:hypothetical protein [Anaerolineales bacterium]
MNSQIRYTSFPRTKPSPSFVKSVVDVFKSYEPIISTLQLAKGLESNQVLSVLCDGLIKIGFDVESGKTAAKKLHRPVFYGENDEPTLRYEIDAFHPGWQCGLEVEAGRAILGNALFRDLFQAMVMVDVNHLCLAVSNAYKYKSGGKDMLSRDYDKAVAVADALYSHNRAQIPYGLTIIGY